MNKDLITITKSNIGDNSNNNFVLQNSNIGQVFIGDSTANTISLLGDLRQYDLIQKQIHSVLDAAKRSHPLFPVFSASYNDDYKKLISTPETTDAFEQYPKTAKGEFLINYKDYPNMSKEETPWEYAYRTQTPIELKTTEYKEYLGDFEDPFPVITFSEGMKTKIVPPPFPKAIEGSLVAGNVRIPVYLRRKPCQEYGQIIIGTESGDSGLEIELLTSEITNKTKLKLTKTFGYGLLIDLQREKLIEAIANTRKLTIKLGSNDLVTFPFEEEQSSADMYIVAPILKKHIENLLFIEEKLKCTFPPLLETIPHKEIEIAHIMAQSLDDKWSVQYLDFDNEIRCDYDHLPEDIKENTDYQSELISQNDVLRISLNGLFFTADNYTVQYKNSTINNLTSILKNKFKKRKGIMITLRPRKGNTTFSKYCKFDNLKYVSDI